MSGKTDFAMYRARGVMTSAVEGGITAPPVCVVLLLAANTHPSMLTIAYPAKMVA